jgi:hypothetical protein
MGTHTHPLVTHLRCVQGQQLGTNMPKVFIHHIPSFTKSFQKLRTVLKEVCLIFKFGSGIIDEYLSDDTCSMQQ